MLFVLVRNEKSMTFAPLNIILPKDLILKRVVCIQYHCSIKRHIHYKTHEDFGNVYILCVFLCYMQKYSILSYHYNILADRESNMICNVKVPVEVTYIFHILFLCNKSHEFSSNAVSKYVSIMRGLTTECEAQPKKSSVLIRFI